MQLPDEVLLARIAQGDEEAYQCLFERYQTRLYNFILRTAGEAMLAEDIFQETFVRIAQKAHTFHPRAKAITWIYRIAYNLSVDALRRNRHLLDSEEITETLADDTEEPLERVAVNAQRAQLEQALSELSAEHRAVVVLSVIEERNHQEIADLVGAPVGTVRSRLHYALRRLERILGPTLSGQEPIRERRERRER